MNPSTQILHSWQHNAANWIATIDNNEIESRQLVTNTAIVETVCNTRVQHVLDVGCGEGWLSRALSQRGMEVFGVDAVAELIAAASAKGMASYAVASYQHLATGTWRHHRLFDAAVINFALIDENDSAALLQALPAYLVAGGLVIIQTLHPFSRIAAGDYKSGWKEGSWDGLKRNFTHAYRWYFRTLEDWMELFAKQYTLVTMKEPLHPVTGQPLSLIVVLQKKEVIQP